MNATGHVKSKWHQKGVTLTLHGTCCVHTFMNLRKKKFISYIYTLFLHRLVHYLWNIFFANKRWRKVIIRRVWLLRSTADTMTWRQSNVTSVSQLLHLSMTSLTHKAAWTNVVYEYMNFICPKQVHLRKLLSSENIVIGTDFIK